MHQPVDKAKLHKREIVRPWWRLAQGWWTTVSGQVTLVQPVLKRDECNLDLSWPRLFTFFNQVTETRVKVDLARRLHIYVWPRLDKFKKERQSSNFISGKSIRIIFYPDSKKEKSLDRTLLIVNPRFMEETLPHKFPHGFTLGTLHGLNRWPLRPVLWCKHW